MSYAVAFVPPNSNKELTFIISGCGTNTTKTYMTGFYYNNNYYGSIGVESHLDGTNNYVQISPYSSWTRIFINGTEFSTSNLTLHAYFR